MMERKTDNRDYLSPNEDQELSCQQRRERPEEEMLTKKRGKEEKRALVVG